MSHSRAWLSWVLRLIQFGHDLPQLRDGDALSHPQLRHIGGPTRVRLLQLVTTEGGLPTPGTYILLILDRVNPGSEKRLGGSNVEVHRRTGLTTVAGLNIRGSCGRAQIGSPKAGVPGRAGWPVLMGAGLNGP